MDLLYAFECRCEILTKEKKRSEKKIRLNAMREKIMKSNGKQLSISATVVVAAVFGEKCKAL